MSADITVKLFSAAWCQPCKALKPQLAAAFGAALRVIDVERESFAPYPIESLPTVVIERDGQYAAMLLAPMTLAQVQAKVAEVTR
jgi:thioredoxin-like negative regulator of GroEL